MVSKPNGKAIVPNCSAFGILWNSILIHHPRKRLSNAPPNSETWQKQRSHPAHMTRPQTRSRAHQSISVPSANHLAGGPTRVFNSGRLGVNTTKNFSPYAQILRRRRHDVQSNMFSLFVYNVRICFRMFRWFKKIR